MKKIEFFIKELNDSIVCAEQEMKKISEDCTSSWTYGQISDVVLPELHELLSYAQNGKVFYKYGKKQRILQSTYIINDSVNFLADTTLGKKIHKLQMVYNSF